MNLKITKKKKDYITGPDFTVYELDGLPQFNIRVNSSAGWSTDPHDKRGRELRLMDRGKRKATIYWKEGNLKTLAKQMHDLTSKTTWGEDRGLTPDDYYEVLKMWVDMGLHESTNKTSLVEKLNSLLEKNVPNDPSKWSYYKSQAKEKFDVYPSAYANAWAAKKYKAAGGTWKKESVNEIKLSSDEKQKLDKAISVTDKVKIGKDRKDAIMYIVKLAKEKTGNYPKTLKQALYFLDYLDESVNEYSRDDIHDNTPLHFGRDSKLGGLLYNRLKSKLNREYGVNKFKVVGRVVMLGNKRLFTITGNMSLNDIFYKILSTTRNFGLKVNEEYYDKSKKQLKKENNMNLREWTDNYIKSISSNINEDLPTKEIDPKQFPNPLPSSKKGFLKKGNYDGDKTDDIVATKPVQITVSKLKPSQSAIYLGKALGMAVGGVEGGDLGAVISKDNYILDGHHRYAATTFNNPSAKVGGVQSDLMIGDLVPVLRAVGDAMKNKRGLAPKGGDVNIFKATMKDVKDAIYNGKNMDSKFYNKEKSIAWFENIGEETIAKRLKMLQSKMPPSGAPARKDMPKIKPSQLGILKTLLNKGNIDVRKPYTESVNEARMSSGNYSVMIGKTLDGFFGTLLVNTRGGKMGTATGIRYNNKSRDKVVKWAEKQLQKVSKEPIVNESVVDTNKISGEIDKISNEITKVTKLYTNAYKKNDVNNYIKYRDKLLNLTNKHIKLIQNMSDTIKATKVNKVNESVNESRTEWYELDEWEDRLKDAINKAKLNPKEKRYFLLRAGEIKSKYDAVELLNDLDAMVKKKVNESNFKYDPSIDYFDDYELLPKKVQDILDTHDFDGESYKAAKQTIKKLNKVGWTADYDLSGDMFDLKPLGESVNEVMDKTQLKAIYDKLQKGDELTIMYTDMWSGKTRGNFIVKKGKTKVGKARVERITLINKNNPRGVRYYLYQRNGFVTFAVGDMAATIDSIVLEESLNEAVSSSKIKASLDKQTDFKLDADDEIKLYPKPIRIEPDKFDSQLKKYSKAFKNPLIYLYGTTANEYGTNTFLAVVSRLKSTTKIIIMSDKYAKAYGKGSLKDSDINGVLKMNSLIASNAELNESVNESNDYFNTATEAVNHAREMIEKRGFEIDEDDWQTQIALGGGYGRLRPSVGKTHSFRGIRLLKNGKPQRKMLQISLYGMPSGKYELTYYVN